MFQIKDAELPSFDRRILHLPLLRTLHIEGSKLEILPESLGSLPCLTQLYLKNNELGKSSKWNWKWILASRIRKNLQVLDLSYNLVITMKLTDMIIKINVSEFDFEKIHYRSCVKSELLNNNKA